MQGQQGPLVRSRHMALKLSKPLFSFELSADWCLNDLFPASELPGPSFPGFEMCLPKTAAAFGVVCFIIHLSNTRQHQMPSPGDKSCRRLDPCAWELIPKLDGQTDEWWGHQRQWDKNGRVESHKVLTPGGPGVTSSRHCGHLT